MRPSTRKAFNEDDFDHKALSKVSLDINEQNTNREYGKWVDENEEHLENLYELSGLDCEFYIFCSFVFANSRNKNKNK